MTISNKTMLQTQTLLHCIGPSNQKKHKASRKEYNMLK